MSTNTFEGDGFEDRIAKLTHSRALEVAALTTGGVITAGILRAAYKWAFGRRHQEQLVEKYTEIFGMLKDDKTDSFAKCYKRTVASLLIKAGGTSPAEIKHMARPIDKQKVLRKDEASVILAGLVGYNAIKYDYQSKIGVVRPRPDFIRAILAQKYELPLLMTELSDIDPNFEIESLEKFATPLAEPDESSDSW